MVPLEIVINCVNSVQDQRNVLSAEEGRGVPVYGYKYLIAKKMCVIDTESEDEHTSQCTLTT